MHIVTCSDLIMCKISPPQSIPVEGLIGGSSEASLDFLHWFKVFFDSNHNGQEYDALESRAGQSMLPANAAKQPQIPKALTQLNFCETQLHALSALFFSFLCEMLV